MNTRNLTARTFKGLATSGLIVMLTACGGGGGNAGGSDDNAVTSESVVARGVITQLGSIWVNGVEYETPKGNSYSSDDSIGTVADYKVGQVVRIRGRRNKDGISGTADEVEYEAEIEGAADGNGDINGIDIIRTVNTNAAGIPDPLSNGVRYEVSGIWINNNIIEATFIKADDDGDGIDEIKGFVEAVNPGVSLTVRGIVFSYGGPTVVSVGDFVEVHFNGTVASEVELEDDFNDENDGQEVEFEGAVNLDPADLATCPGKADFLIETTCIDWDSVPANGWMDGLVDESDMISGVRAEVEGHFNSTGLLIAEKIKGRGNRVRIASTATNVTDPDFDLFFGDIQVTTMNAVTEYDLDNMGTSVASITSGDGLEVRGIRTGPTSMLALRIKSKNVNANRHEIRAVVDNGGADPSNNTITVMGITSVAGANTELEIEDVEITPDNGPTSEADIDAFLDLIDDDGIVSVSNGPNDVVDVRVDTTNGGDGSIGNSFAADKIELEEEDD